MADKEAEQIKYETERWRFLCLLAVAVGGASFSLFLGVPTPFRVGLAILGLLATVVLIGVIWHQDRRIMALIEQITKEDV